MAYICPNGILCTKPQSSFLCSVFHSGLAGGLFRAHDPDPDPDPDPDTNKDTETDTDADPETDTDTAVSYTHLTLPTKA